ncbi:MAG TPA: chloride channel protein [Thermoanaerobaculia bacterium]|jgi:H+/Cl- antiporter ClcA/CBS domain-containing protein|nr:chloride channel protein [Thermoanaerobaculia bacterium]
MDRAAISAALSLREDSVYAQTDELSHPKPHQHRDKLADFSTDRRVLVLSGLAGGIGVLAALVAYALVWLIAVITNLAYYQRFSSQFVSPAGNHLGGWAVLVPMIGGLVIGLMARYGSEKIRGHGIPEALEAILIGRSRVEPKVAVLKPVSSALSIGTGGPFGAEGPIIMTGGAVGSLIAQLFHLSSAERKTLLVAGAAAGMAAIFATPMAAVLLAVELLLFEWKPRSFIPVAVASVVAAVVRVPLLGAGPIFPVPGHAVLGAETLGFAIVVGLLAGVASGLLTALVYACEDLFAKLPVHWMWWPILGGLAIGVGGLLDPRVLGVGYDSIQDLLAGHLTGGSAASLLFLKALVWAVALGSGTSGGVLAPLLIMGGGLGVLESGLIPVGDAGLWAMVSMSAMMGGTMRSPLTAILFTVELTHDWNVLPALMVGAVIAHGTTVLLLRRSILTEKLARRGHHLVREYSVDPFEVHRIGEVMDRDVVNIPATMTVAELSARIAAGDPALTGRQGIPIVDAGGELAGIITRSDLMRAMESEQGRAASVLEAGTQDLIVAYPDEILRDAVARMLAHDIGRLPIVDRHDRRRLLGYLGRAGIMRARVQLFREENLRERGGES